MTTTAATKAASSHDPATGFAFEDKVVLAYYYMWYTEGKWLDPPGDGGRQELEGLHPLVGAYNSSDPAIIDSHLQQLERARVDALACSWWLEPGERGMNRKLDMVYDAALSRGLKVTVDFERGGSSLDRIYEELHYFLERYKEHPAMLRVEGDAVVMVWTSWAHTPEEWRDIFHRLEAEGLRSFPIVSGDFDVCLEAEFTSKYLGPFRSLEQYTLVDNEDCELAAYMQGMRATIDEYNEREGHRTGRPAQLPRHHITRLRRDSQPRAPVQRRWHQGCRLEGPGQIRCLLPRRPHRGLLPRHLRGRHELQPALASRVHFQRAVRVEPH